MKPQDLFGSVTQFLSSFFPGVVLIYCFLIFYPEVLYHLDLKGNGTEFVIPKEIILLLIFTSAYVLGQFVQFGSAIIINDWWLERLDDAANTMGMFTPAAEYFRNRKNRTTYKILEPAVIQVRRTFENYVRQFEDELARKYLDHNLDEWCQEYISIKNKEAAADIAFWLAAYRLFRAFSIVFLIIALIRPVAILLASTNVIATEPRADWNVPLLIACSVVSLALFVKLRSQHRRKTYTVTLMITKIEYPEEFAALSVPNPPAKINVPLSVQVIGFGVFISFLFLTWYDGASQPQRNEVLPSNACLEPAALGSFHNAQ